MENNLNIIENWVVFKECPIAGCVLSVNSEIQLVHGCIYVNGCLMDTFYQGEILNLLRIERKKPNYLRKLK